MRLMLRLSDDCKLDDAREFLERYSLKLTLDGKPLCNALPTKIVGINPVFGFSGEDGIPIIPIIAEIDKFEVGIVCSGSFCVKYPLTAIVILQWIGFTPETYGYHFVRQWKIAFVPSEQYGTMDLEPELL